MNAKTLFHSFMRGLLETAGLVIIGWIVFRILKALGHGVFGVVLFIIIVTFGFLIISIRNVKYKHDSLAVFLSDMALIITITIVSFAVAFSSNPVNENDYIEVGGIPKELTFSEAVYFSIITLSTVGYGDMAPYGVYRIFAATEGLLGFLYLGVFVSGLTLFMARPRKR